MVLLSGGNFLKAEYVKQGDELIILNGGEWTESKYEYPAQTMKGQPHPMAGQKKKDLIFHVAVGTQQYDFRCNQTNQKAILEKFGRDTDDWANTVHKINVVKVSVSGKLQDSIVLEPIGKATDETLKNIAWEP